MEKKRERECGTDICYHTDEPWKHYAKWNKPVTKRQILHDSTYLSNLEIKLIEGESILKVNRGWEKVRTESYCLMVSEFLFGVMKNFGNSSEGCKT